MFNNTGTENTARVTLYNVKNIVFDGDGHTIYGPTEKIKISDSSYNNSYLFASRLVDSTIKNVTFNLTDIMPSLSGDLRGKCTFENITFTGSTSWENNTGLFSVYFDSGLMSTDKENIINVINCTNNANITGTQNNALIVGYPNGKVTINIDGFTNNGRYVDQKAGIVIGNSAGDYINNEYVINISNFDNSNGIISSLTSDTVNPYIASVTNPESGYTSLKLTVDGVVLVNGIISGTGVDDEEVNCCYGLWCRRFTACLRGTFQLMAL